LQKLRADRVAEGRGIPGAGLSALWISGRLVERITEQDPERLAAAVSGLFVEAVLPQYATPPEHA
jgi:hypothetical protein